MKKKVVILAAAAVLLLMAKVYLWGPSSVPAGQEPLVALSPDNFGEFEAAFDKDADAPRLILLLSPT